MNRIQSNAQTPGTLEHFVYNLWFVKEADPPVHIEWYLGIGRYAGRQTAVILFPDKRRMSIIKDESGIYMKVHPEVVSGRNGYGVYEVVEK